MCILCFVKIDGRIIRMEIRILYFIYTLRNEFLFPIDQYRSCFIYIYVYTLEEIKLCLRFFFPSFFLSFMLNFDWKFIRCADNRPFVKRVENTDEELKMSTVARGFLRPSRTKTCLINHALEARILALPTCRGLKIRAR